MTNGFLSLGSNRGSREALLEASVEAITKLEKTKITQMSSIYETEPWGIEDQALFLNQVVEIETELEPSDLIGSCRNIEKQLGRQAGRSWGPREIDIDLLLYGHVKIKNETIQVPHPYLSERRFVLVPLAEIAPELEVPGFGQTVQSLLNICPDQKSVRLHRPLAYQS